jgi:energy-coupling factor transporter ATP-binding protein EcfA2
LAAGLLIISSTHEAAFPREWREPSFWARWETIFLGFDNDQAGEALACVLAESAGKDVRRALVPRSYGKDWTEFWQGGGGLDEFAGLLRDAPVFSLTVKDGPGEVQGYGRFAYQPININGAFHNGHLYYAAQILNRSVVVNTEGNRSMARDVERLETVVVRSDRTIHTSVLTDAPKGTRERDRVMRLTDGTLIDREPQPNRYGTWSWPSIKVYLDGKSKPRALGEILRDVNAYLRACVWLPFEEDYSVLTLLVPVTFAQAVFDSVPLVFVNGPTGSGKSELGRAMARVCCNAYVCGQSSAAAIARFIDESRGFVVLDDMEMLGSRGGQFGELVQALKLSYNKATAVKLWTDVKTMRTRLLDFYGVKMINNTRGTGEILGSRMIKIRTGRIPEAMRSAREDLPNIGGAKLSLLRDEFHCWTFGNVRRIEEAYRRLYPRAPDRSDEITAPLRVLAAIADDVDLISKLEVALAKQSRQVLKTDDPRQVVLEALKNLVAQGYTTVSPTHVTLEARRLIGQGGGSPAGDTPEWLKPGWVGRILHGLEVLDEGPGGHKRVRLFGMNLRFFRIRDAYVTEVEKWFESRGTIISAGARQPTDFCRDCGSCQYNVYGCEIMRVRRDLKQPSVKCM